VCGGKPVPTPHVQPSHVYNSRGASHLDPAPVEGSLSGLRDGWLKVVQRLSLSAWGGETRAYFSCGETLHRRMPGADEQGRGSPCSCGR
jgi:hypothetical protein